MHGTERRQRWVWTAIIAAALVLLIVIVLSTRSRPVETETVVQQAPPQMPATTQAPPAATAPAPEPAEPVPPAADPPGPETRVAGQRETAPAEPPRSPAAAPGSPGGTAAVTPARPTADPQPDARAFGNTGLPSEITYRGQEWAALEVIEGLPDRLLEADEQKVNGLTVYHDRNAEPPFTHVYIPVAGQTDQYVRYGPAGL